MAEYFTNFRNRIFGVESWFKGELFAGWKYIKDMIFNR